MGIWQHIWRFERCVTIALIATKALGPDRNIEEELIKLNNDNKYISKIYIAALLGSATILQIFLVY